jgi:Na+/melibiose symporter-like transporter
VAQTPQVLLLLRILYVAVPCACNAVAFAILLAYPIDRSAHEAIAAALVERRAGEEVRDPLANASFLRSSGRR